MAKQKFHCNTCGDTFTVSKETEELLEDGFIEYPRQCSDCSDPEYDMSYEQYSDADCGL